MKIVSTRLVLLLLLSTLAYYLRGILKTTNFSLKRFQTYTPKLRLYFHSTDFHNSVNSFIPAFSVSGVTGLKSIPQNPLSSKDLARLKEMQIYNSRMLLEANALPIIFEMLTKAIADKDSFETGFWSACLSNNISGYSDMNNIAEVVYLSDYIPSLSPDLLDPEGKAISMRGSATASLNDAFRHDLSNDAYNNIIAKNKAQIITTNPEEMTHFLLMPTYLYTQKHSTSRKLFISQLTTCGSNQ